MMNAVATIGVICSREHRPQFFTSNLYPHAYDESIRQNPPGITHGIDMTQPEDEYEARHPHIISGTLTEVIRYPVYDHQPPEEVGRGDSRILSGTLQTVIAYKTIDHNPPEEWEARHPHILSGTLTVTINYVTNTTPIEQYELGGVGIISGTLT
jgi:hypothetical protein